MAFVAPSRLRSSRSEHARTNGACETLRLARLARLTPSALVVALLSIMSRMLFEVVVHSESALVGKTPKAAKFLERYNGAIVAIGRMGEYISGRVREQPTLLDHPTTIDSSRVCCASRLATLSSVAAIAC